MSTNPLFDQGGEATAAKPAGDEGEQVRVCECRPVGFKPCII